MSYFNWPDIPFSGTEVDAFVVEYKALAESIIDDFDQNTLYTDQSVRNTRSLKLPYRKENVITFLEHGLLYAAFIVKQRAGNAGPGTDFNLENSPLPLPLPPGPGGRTIKDIGPSAEEEALKRCFEDHQEGKKNGSGGSGGNGGSGGGPGSGGPGGNPPPGDDESDDPDDPNVPPAGPFPGPEGDVMSGSQNSSGLEEDCPTEIEILDKARQAIQQGGIQCLENALLVLFGGVLGNILQVFRWTYQTGMDMTWVTRYFNGVGGVLTVNDLKSILSPDADTWLREDVMVIANNQISAGTSGIKMVPMTLTSSERAAFGMSATDNMYQIGQLHKFKNSLGWFRLITDGTERQYVTPGGPQIELTNINQIKQIRDDYDFENFGLVIDRTLGIGGVAGDPFNDDMIKTGADWQTDETTACQAAQFVSGSDDGKWDYAKLRTYLRYLISSNTLTKTEAGEYIRTACRGKPFAVHLDWR